MKDTKISLVSGVSDFNPLISSDERINQKCLSMLSKIDKEKEKYYNSLKHAIAGKDNSQLETMGYVFSYDYMQDIPAELIVKDMQDMLISKDNFSVSDEVKNSLVYDWWHNVIVLGNKMATPEEQKAIEYIYDNAIHYMYSVVDNSLLSNIAINKKKMQLAIMKSYPLPIEVSKILVSYSIYEHLRVTPLEAVELLKYSRISGAADPLEVSDLLKSAAQANEDALRAKLTEGSGKSGSLADEVGSYADTATKLSEEIRKWFGKGDKETYVYNGNNYTPNYSDFSSNTTTMVMVAGGALLLLALFLTKKK